MYTFYSYLEPRASSSYSMRGRLTERLLAQGLLTPAMLQELKREWNQQGSDTNDEDNDKTNNSSKYRRKRKPK